MRRRRLTEFEVRHLVRDNEIGAFIAEREQGGAAVNAAVEEAAATFHVSLRTAYRAWCWWRLVQPTEAARAEEERRAADVVRRAWLEGLKLD
jgi:hypothetical protein